MADPDKSQKFSPSKVLLFTVTVAVPLNDHTQNINGKLLSTISQSILLLVFH